MPISIQTEYTRDHREGYHGARASLEPEHEITAFAEEAIPMGSFVVRGAAEDSCVLPGSSGDVTTNAFAFGGFALRRQIDIANPSLTPEELRYEIGNEVNVLFRGTVWTEVLPGDTVAQDGAVFIRFQNGNEGRAVSDAQGGDAVALIGCFFVNSGVAGEVVRVRYIR